MKTRSAIASFGLVVCVWTLPLAGQSRSSAPEPWRTSWPKFAEAVESFEKSAQDFPQGLDSVKTGQVVPDTREVMKRFGGPVTFEGTFKAVTTEGLLEGMTAKLILDMAPSKFTFLHVYPKPAAIAAWRAVTPGTTVRFKAVVKGIAGVDVQGIPGVTRMYMLLLQDAETTSR